MKIGFLYDMHTDLEHVLYQGGHHLNKHLGVAPKDDHLAFYKDQTTYCSSTFDIGKDADLCIVNNENSAVYEKLRHLGIPCIGSGAMFYDLEEDRVFAKLVAEAHGLKIPRTWEPASLEEAQAIIEEVEGNVVIKAGMNFLGDSDFRTIVPVCQDDASTFLKDMWKFYEDEESEMGCKGAFIIEEKIIGAEVAFGAWFNGSKFLLPYNVNFEHKPAQNGGRGGILTGEVGTLLFHENDTSLKPWKFLTSLTPILAGRYHGMFDINCMLSKTGDLYFLEFTPRFGFPTLAVMMSLYQGKDFAELLLRVAKGEDFEPAFSKDFGCGVCAFTYGMPLVEESDVQVNPLIHGLPAAREIADVKLLHAALKDTETDVRAVWNCRSLIVNGMDPTVEGARKKAYDAIKHIKYWSMTYRDDIAATWATNKSHLHEHGYIRQDRATK